MATNPIITCSVWVMISRSGVTMRRYASVPIELYTTRMLTNDKANTTAQITLSPLRLLSAHILMLLIMRRYQIVFTPYSFPVLLPVLSPPPGTGHRDLHSYGTGRNSHRQAKATRHRPPRPPAKPSEPIRACLGSPVLWLPHR